MKIENVLQRFSCISFLFKPPCHKSFILGQFYWTLLSGFPGTPKSRPCLKLLLVLNFFQTWVIWNLEMKYSQRFHQPLFNTFRIITCFLRIPDQFQPKPAKQLHSSENWALINMLSYGSSIKWSWKRPNLARDQSKAERWKGFFWEPTSNSMEIETTSIDRK